MKKKKKKLCTYICEYVYDFKDKDNLVENAA